MILLGINESGKSNILEAISMLSSGQEVDYDTYCNKRILEEKEDTSEGSNFEKYISIIYEYTCDKHDNYEEELFNAGVDKELASIIEIKRIRRKIKIDTNNKPSCSTNCIYETTRNELERYVLNDDETKVEVRTTVEILRVGYADKSLDAGRLNDFLHDKWEGIFSNYFPQVIFWKPYEEEYLIHDETNLESFMNNPDTFIPLRNCFRIAGINNISEKIKSAMGCAGSISNLRELLNSKVTQHVNKVWKEHKINIQFEFDSSQLFFFIKEKTNNLGNYKFNQRSDGCKYFISFLLNFSAGNQTGKLKNNIILLDEPEAHLHPSGQKYFRDELLEIAKTNLVIFATHSIYMADKENLDRHISTVRVDEVTCISSIERDNPYKEQVLYEALGTSILEHIESSALILEGKTDKTVFELYKNKFRNDIASPNLSLIPTDGCGDIKKYTKFANNKLIKWFVLTDSDKAGQKLKKIVQHEAESYDKDNLNVFEINDVLATNKESTLEDLFDCEFITESVKEIYGLEFVLDTSKPFLEQVKATLNKRDLKDKNKMNELKKAIFNKISELSKTKLKQQKYFQFFKKLQKKLNDAPAN